MKKETQSMVDVAQKVNVIDSILAKKLVGGTGTGSDAGIIAPCVHPVTPPKPPVVIPGFGK
jgi:hypothetical protein